MRVPIATIAAACLGLAPWIGSAAGDIHRCIESGRVVYTDRGCNGNGELIAAGAMVRVASVSMQESHVDVRGSMIALGMSPRDVHTVLGRPYETIATLQGRRLVEYWVYRDAAGITRVVFEEGRVTGIRPR